MAAYPGAADDNGVEGATTVYFDDPRLNGQEVSAWTPHAADAFCRVEGLNSALYFDQSRSAASAVTTEGRPVGQGPILGDVLCRK